jgi:hypothetical protein
MPGWGNSTDQSGNAPIVGERAQDHEGEGGGQMSSIQSIRSLSPPTLTKVAWQAERSSMGSHGIVSIAGGEWTVAH